MIVLSDDAMVKSHLNDLYNTLLEQNLSRIIEPFSRVEMAHVAELIDLPVKQVETKYGSHTDAACVRRARHGGHHSTGAGQGPLTSTSRAPVWVRAPGGGGGGAPGFRK